MSAWSGLGICVGNENSGRTPEQWDADFRLFKSIGIKTIRVLQASYDWGGKVGDTFNYNDYTKAIALRAKEVWNFPEVIWGVCAGRHRLNHQSDLDDFVYNATYGLLAHSDFASAHGLVFQFMNEEEAFLSGSDFTQAQIRSFSRDANALIKARHPELSTIRNVDNVNWFPFTQEAPCADRMGLNCYATYVKDNDFFLRANAWMNKWGRDVAVITEWNCSASSGEFGNEELEATKIAIRQKMLIGLNYKLACFFCSRWENSGADDQFAVFKKNGTKKLWWNTIATNNGRRFFV